jgi:MSHA biogenesis protein MshO
MRRILPDALPRAARGLTLIELVLAMVIVGIVVAATIFFAYPVTQSVELTGRAELTDIADNSLQRIAREVRLALPNSVRDPGCGVSCIEFIPVRTAGRYRAEASAPAVGCDTGADVGGSDELAFDVADTCFKSIGTVPNAATITNADFLVLNNTGLDDQNAYVASANPNRVQVQQADEQGGARERINFLSFTFRRALHDSPGKRFFIVTTPVTFACEGSTLKRYSGYGLGALYTTGTSVKVADDVAGCTFIYTASVSPQIGLLTLKLTLSRTLSTTTETVSLYHAVHVSNVP